MEDVRDAKNDIRQQAIATIDQMDADVLADKKSQVVQRLFDFANFLEANIVLYYIHSHGEMETTQIIEKSYEYNKIIVLPGFNADQLTMELLKVDDFPNAMKTGGRGILEPDQKRCKKVPIDCIDLALIPGVAFDEKGGRIGTGRGYYDRFIPSLPVTTRKVGLAFEEQVSTQIPMESHDKYIDIIITDRRTIYKI